MAAAVGEVSLIQAIKHMLGTRLLRYPISTVATLLVGIPGSIYNPRQEDTCCLEDPALTFIRQSPDLGQAYW